MCRELLLRVNSWIVLCRRPAPGASHCGWAPPHSHSRFSSVITVELIEGDVGAMDGAILLAVARKRIPWLTATKAMHSNAKNPTAMLIAVFEAKRIYITYNKSRESTLLVRGLFVLGKRAAMKIAITPTENRPFTGR